MGLQLGVERPRRGRTARRGPPLENGESQSAVDVSNQSSDTVNEISHKQNDAKKTTEKLGNRPVGTTAVRRSRPPANQPIGYAGSAKLGKPSG